VQTLSKIHTTISDTKFKIFYIFAIHGALAQLARVPDWQSGGHEFDPRTLHLENQGFKHSEGDAFFIQVLFQV
jgi:hypothetical protein